ncbi:protein-export chaperone SecB [Vagococcus lutrae]|uniref:protein-export chaperone SecB n=1 Tax=Vagococcus lutrae TaxID=81947 RepID=UPI00288C8A9B|nr:protein-export chaperone SecB [Vagococcus lutrae]MDT2824860.1 protein-export chaperone SecB [Vagococcus lutrae]
MASINFKNYFFDELTYKFNINFDSENSKELDVSHSFASTVEIFEKEAFVRLIVELGDVENVNCPFSAKVSLVGLFEYTHDSSETKDKLLVKELLSNNSIAILYPYIRNIVSDLTLQANQFPAYILPVINVVQMMKDQNSIEVIDHTN